MGIAAYGFGGGGRHGQVKRAMGQRWWGQDEGVQVPAGDIQGAVGGGQRVAVAIGQDRADRQAADFHAQGFGAVGVGQAGSDRAELDAAVFRAFIELVADVVAFAIATVQIGQADAGAGQVRRTGVQRHMGAAQVGDRTVAHLQIDVVVARAVLVVVVDLQRVIAADRRGDRAIEIAVLAPGGACHGGTAHGDQQAVIAAAAEGVGLAGLQIDQAGGFRGDILRDAGGLHIGHGGVGGGLGRVGGVEGGFQQGGIGAVAAAIKGAQAGPGFLDQPGGDHGRNGGAQGRRISQRGDIDLERRFAARRAAANRFELDLGVVGLLVADAGAAVTIGAGLVVGRGEDQLAGVDVGFADDLVGGHVGQDAIDVQLQRAVGRQVGDFHPLAGHGRVDVGDPEVGPGQSQRLVFNTCRAGARSTRRVVVVEGGGDAALGGAGHQLLKVAAAVAVDGDGEFAGILDEVIVQGKEIERDTAGALEDGHRGLAGEVGAIDGGAAVAQGDGHVTLGFVVQRQGVVGGVPFGDGRVAGDAQGGGVGGVRDQGISRACRGRQAGEVVAGGAGNGDLDGVGVDVDIVVSGRNGHGTTALARANGDGLLVVQGHGHRIGMAGDPNAVGIDQGRGVGDIAAFFNGAGGGQLDVVSRRDHFDRQVQGHALRVAAHAFGGGRGHGQDERGVGHLRWRQDQGVQVPAGDIQGAVGGGQRVAVAIGQDRADRQAADGHLQGFGAVGIGQASGDRAELDAAVFHAVVERLADVIAFAAAAVQVG